MKIIKKNIIHNIFPSPKRFNCNIIFLLGGIVFFAAGFDLNAETLNQQDETASFTVVLAESCRKIQVKKTVTKPGEDKNPSLPKPQKCSRIPSNDYIKNHQSRSPPSDS